MNRTTARKKAFELIYSYSLNSEYTPDEILENFYLANEIENEDYINETVKNTIENIEAIDNLIKNNLKNWSIHRIAKVSLAILRIATYEIKFNDSIPNSVAINEAVEIAKEYGNDDAPSFINGVLSSIAGGVK